MNFFRVTVWYVKSKIAIFHEFFFETIGDAGHYSFDGIRGGGLKKTKKKHRRQIEQGLKIGKGQSALKIFVQSQKDSYTTAGRENIS